MMHPQTGKYQVKYGRRQRRTRSSVKVGNGGGGRIMVATVKGGPGGDRGVAGERGGGEGRLLFRCLVPGPESRLLLSLLSLLFPLLMSLLFLLLLPAAPFYPCCHIISC